MNENYSVAFELKKKSCHRDMNLLNITLRLIINQTDVAEVKELLVFGQVKPRSL